MSSYLFDCLKKDSIVETKKTFFISSTQGSILSLDCTKPTKPYDIIKYKVSFENLNSNNKNNFSETNKYQWDVWNCGSEEKLIENPKSIPESNLLINCKKLISKKLKTESYIIEFGSVKIVMKITCIKNFKLYKEKLKNELFIERIFDAINYYDDNYGCVGVNKIKK